MKIFLPNVVQLSKNQVATNSPSLAWMCEAAPAAILATSVESAAAISLFVLWQFGKVVASLRRGDVGMFVRFGTKTDAVPSAPLPPASDAFPLASDAFRTHFERQTLDSTHRTLRTHLL
jgi:hypothetical protein